MGRARDPMRVVFYSDETDGIGGAEMHTNILLESLSAAVEPAFVGVDQRVLDWTASRHRSLRSRLVPRIESKADFSALAAHVRTFRAIRPDVVQVSLWNPWSGRYAMLAAFLLRIPVVTVLHPPIAHLGGRPAFPEFARPRSPRAVHITRMLLMRCAARVAVGELVARQFEELLHLPPRSIRTIHNAVGDDDVDPTPRAFGDGPVVGSIGRLHVQKGFDVLLQALPALPGVTVVLVGEGDQRQELEGLARELGVEERVVLTGWSEDPRSLLPAFDVFALPSRSEAFPLVILEAMLARLPVVATDVGSVCESVLHEETGLLVAPGDPAALAGALSRLLSDRELRERFGGAGRTRALTEFAPDAMAQRFEALYRELVP